MESGAAGAESGLSVPFDEAIRSLPCPTALIAIGSGQVLFANRAAAEMEWPGADGATACYMADAQGHRLPRDQTPTARAARGEEFTDWRVTWHSTRSSGIYHATARRLSHDHAGHPAAAVTLVDISQLALLEAELRQNVNTRDEFVSVATHELKEPLNSMLLSLELLQSTAEDRPTLQSAEVLSQLEIIRRQGDRLARLIDNLLEVSRVSNHRLRIDPEALDLCELVRECVVQFGRDAQAAGTTITMEPCQPTVGYFDRLKLEQVVSNLALCNQLRTYDVTSLISEELALFRPEIDMPTASWQT